MSRHIKIIAIVVGAIMVLGLVGAGVALAADPPKSPADWQGTFTAKVAKILGVEPQKLQDAYLQAHNEMIDEAVAAGRLTKEQADRMKERMKQAGQDGRPPMMGPGGSLGWGPMGRMPRGYKGMGPDGSMGKDWPKEAPGRDGKRPLPPWQRTPTPTQ